MTPPAPVITGELRSLLRAVKLGQLLPTLPERLTLARAHHLSHAQFLELILSDEVTRRDATSAARRARAAGLDAAMRLDRFDDTAKITYDRAVLDELFSLRFVADATNAIIMGPVGVGKTFLATALGHAAVRGRHSVHFERAGQLLKRLKAARLDNSHDEQIRRGCCAPTCSSSTIFACTRWTPPTPPTSTRSSSSGTGPRPPWSPPTANRLNGWP